MSELSPATRALLAEAGARHDPSEQQLERGLDALHATLAFTAPTLVASTASASSAAPVVKAAAAKGALLGVHAAKLYVVAAIVIGSLGTVATWPTRAPVVDAPPEAVAPAATTLPEATLPPEPTPPEPTLPPALEAAPKPVRVRGSDISAELRLIEAAQRDLQRAQPARALEQLEQHARSHARGQLAGEREGLRAIALCEAGRVAQGQAARDAFLARHGQTPIAARVRKACP